MLFKNLPVILPLLAAGGVFGQQPSFTNIDFNPSEDAAGVTYGAIWGDFNGDGYEDAFLCNGPNENQLFVNNGDGTFTEKLYPGLLSTAGKDSYSASWGDYDNDGHLDLFIATTGKNIVLKNNGDETFTSVSNALTAMVNFSYPKSTSASWADIDRDGWLDALEVSLGSRPNYFINSSGATFTRQELPFTGQFYNASWSDLNNDLYPELFVASYSSSNLFFQNEAGTLTVAASGDIVTEAGDFYGGSWADYDNDGDMDLFVSVAGSLSSNMLFRNDNGQLVRISAGSVTTDAGDSRASAWGDFDNDGWIDLYVANSGTDNILYRNNGDGSFTRITDANIDIADGYSSSCSWIDFDRNGFLDLFVTDWGTAHKNIMYRNQGNGSGWFLVKLKGTRSNAAAIGAKIRIKAAIGGSSFWQTREISGQNAYATQSGLLAHFGLGDAATIDTVKVEWPSGIVQVYANLSGNQYMEITEIEPPVAPVSLVASADGSDRIALSWTEDTNEDLFIIEQSAGDNSNFQKIGESGANSASFVINGLHPNTTYFYRIKAKNASGESGYSPEASATTDPVSVIAPSELTAAALSPFEIQLSWADNSDNDDYFVIERSTTSGDGFSWLDTTMNRATFIDDIQLSPSTTYYYRVKAIADGESSAYTNEASTTTPDLVIAAPTGLTAAATPIQVALSWTDNSDNETGFVITRNLNGDVRVFTVDANVQAYEDHDVIEDVSYEYSIKAVYDSYESGFATITVAVPPFIVQPDALTASAVSHDQIDLSWNDNADNETGYLVERATEPEGPFTAIHTTAPDMESYSDANGLQPATIYYYRVRAINAVHGSKYSNGAEAATLDYSPVTVIIPDLHGLPGQEIVVPVYIRNFRDVLSAQFTVYWDPLVLSYLSVSDPAISGIECFSPRPEALVFTWSDEGGATATIPDNEVLFNMHFTIAGSLGSSTSVTASTEASALAVMEFGDENGQVMDQMAIPGSVRTSIRLAGAIKDIKGNPVKNVGVLLSGDQLDSLVNSGDDGRFEFLTIPGNAIEIAPGKLNDAVVNNGVTTLDIALIRRHIAYIKAIGNPYQLISADVNDDGSITMRDVAEIRSLILARETVFSGGLWQFVPEGYIFADPSNPFPFDRKVTVSSLVNDENINFTGIKLGDVNNSWDASKARIKTGKTLYLDVEPLMPDDLGTAGFNIKASDFTNLSGFQFTIRWDAAKMQLESVAGNPLNAYFGNHRVNDGYLTVAWDEPSIDGVSLEDGALLLDLKFNVLQPSAGTIRINSDLTQSIAYDAALDEVEILARNPSSGNPGGHELTLYPNYPNPFGAEGTTFNFSLKEDGKAKFSIFNAMGILVDKLEGNFVAGKNEMEWQPTDKLPGGIYFYSMESNGRKFAGKVVITD